LGFSECDGGPSFKRPLADQQDGPTRRAQLENNALSRYPCPDALHRDQCGEFLGNAVTTTIEVNNGVKLLIPTTVKNPQANSICEVVHQTIGNTLRTVLLANQPNSILDADGFMKSVFLANVMHATDASLNRSLVNNSAGALALIHRDIV
jgi:hypothetical protein